MSTTTVTTHLPSPREASAPVLVSEIPAVALTGSRPSAWARLRDNLVARHDSRTFERAIRGTMSSSETSDLFAARRRD